MTHEQRVRSAKILRRILGTKSGWYVSTDSVASIIGDVRYPRDLAEYMMDADETHGLVDIARVIGYLVGEPKETRKYYQIDNDGNRHMQSDGVTP